jgi:hypothetical protein
MFKNSEISLQIPKKLFRNPKISLQLLENSWEFLKLVYKY